MTDERDLGNANEVLIKPGQHRWVRWSRWGKTNSLVRLTVEGLEDEQGNPASMSCGSLDEVEKVLRAAKLVDEGSVGQIHLMNRDAALQKQEAVRQQQSGLATARIVPNPNMLRQGGR